MRQWMTTLEIATRGHGFTDLTSRVGSWVDASGVSDGLLTLFLRHTSASLVIQENADPDVLADLADAYARLAPEGDRYRHTAEGLDDCPAHIRTALGHTSLSVPVWGNRLALGTWQAIYLWEHRRAPQRREVVLHLSGEAGGGRERR